MNFLCCATLQKISMLYSLPHTVGCKPVLPPDLKAKRSVVLRLCDYKILNKKYENIKTEIKKQNVYVKVQYILKYDSSKIHQAHI